MPILPMMVRSAVMIRRTVVIVALAAAFLVMASVFSPYRTRAGDAADRPAVQSPARSSTDPHQGLRSLGSVEDKTYTVEIYATDLGPRYSVYTSATRELLGTLLTAEQVHEQFPELQLPTMDFASPEGLLLADTPGSDR